MDTKAEALSNSKIASPTPRNTKLEWRHQNARRHPSAPETAAHTRMHPTRCICHVAEHAHHTTPTTQLLTRSPDAKRTYTTSAIHEIQHSQPTSRGLHPATEHQILQPTKQPTNKHDEIAPLRLHRNLNPFQRTATACLPRAPDLAMSDRHGVQSNACAQQWQRSYPAACGRKLAPEEARQGSLAAPGRGGREGRGRSSGGVRAAALTPVE